MTNRFFPPGASYYSPHHPQQDAGRRLVLLTNNGSEPARVRVRVPGFTPARAVEILNEAPLMLSEDDASVALELAPWGGAVVSLEEAR